MSLPTGLGAQLMVGEETTHGVAVTPNRGFEFVSESLAMEIERLESQGLRAGQRVLRSDRWRPGAKTVGGDIQLEIANKSIGMWLKHAFGSVSTSQPDAAGNPTVYEHLFTPGALPEGLTVQVGRPDENGTVRPFTYEGCVVESWELSASTGEIGQLTVTLSGEDETTATGLATATYPSGLTLMTFADGVLEVDDVVLDVTQATISGANSLNVDRRKIGSALRRKPREQSWREYTAEVEAYFTDLTAYQRFVNGTTAKLELGFVGPTISGPYQYELRVTATVRFDGTTPTVGGPDEVMQPLACKVVDDGTRSIEVLFRTTDTTP